VQLLHAEQFAFATYTEENPVRGGLVREASEHPWSSARGRGRPPHCLLDIAYCGNMPGKTKTCSSCTPSNLPSLRNSHFKNQSPREMGALSLIHNG